MEKHNREANLELIELASSEATMTKEEEFAFYMDRGLRSKASLLEEIKDCNKDNGVLKARMILKEETLIKWIEIVETFPKAKTKTIRRKLK